MNILYFRILYKETRTYFCYFYDENEHPYVCLFLSFTIFYCCIHWWPTVRRIVQAHRLESKPGTLRRRTRREACWAYLSHSVTRSATCFAPSSSASYLRHSSTSRLLRCALCKLTSLSILICLRSGCVQPLTLWISSSRWPSLLSLLFCSSCFILFSSIVQAFKLSACEITASEFEPVNKSSKCNTLLISCIHHNDICSYIIKWTNLLCDLAGASFTVYSLVWSFLRTGVFYQWFCFLFKIKLNVFGILWPCQYFFRTKNKYILG